MNIYKRFSLQILIYSVNIDNNNALITVSDLSSVHIDNNHDSITGTVLTSVHISKHFEYINVNLFFL